MTNNAEGQEKQRLYFQNKFPNLLKVKLHHLPTSKVFFSSSNCSFTALNAFCQLSSLNFDISGFLSK